MTVTAGCIRRQKDEQAPGNLPSTVESCKWSIEVEPTYGWGPQAGKQQSTAGWLAALPVFEPHWQVGAQSMAALKLRMSVASAPQSFKNTINLLHD